MEYLAYRIKHSFPAIFRLMAAFAEKVTAFRFGKNTRNALAQATIGGSIKEQQARIAALSGPDTASLELFLKSLPKEHLEYFHPHRFDKSGLERVLNSAAYMNYGLFVEQELAGYALLKLSPTGSAYIGLLIHPQYSGMGLGSFLVKYLYWQASLAGLKTRSTISRHNPASINSHKAVADFEVIAELPNDYMMIQFPRSMPSKPVLQHGSAGLT